MRAARAERKSLLITVAVAAITAVCCIFGLAGCGSKDVFELVAPSEVKMYVGETRDLMSYLAFSPDVKEKQASFSSSDDGIAEITGSIVRAVAVGSATVTVRAGGEEESITISVEYRAASTLEITTDGSAVQNVNDISDVTPVIFGAEADDFIDPDTKVEWAVDGKAAAQDGEFVFTPTRFGEYAITAKLQDLTETVYVKIYRATDACGKADGEIIQMRNYTPVVFSAHEDIDTRNPKSVVGWTVNGEHASDDKVFVFTPTAQGVYNIELYVNGVKRKIGEKESVAVEARGERAPSGKVTFDADGVYIKWSDGAKARSVVITDPGGVRTAYSSSDIDCAYRFGSGVFDATGLINVTSRTPGEYSIAVSAAALGETSFMQYGEDARAYIENKLLVNNSFIERAERGGEFILELYVCGKSSAQAYIARGADKEKVTSFAKTRASELGLDIAVTMDGDIMTVELGEYVNAPTENADPIPERGMYSVLPHIEYNETNRRASDYALAIDRIARTVEVVGSEQLLFAVMSGLKPLPKDNSAAKIVYDNARRMLISIMGKDYSDFRKVHAIYDHLQWCGYKANAVTAAAENSSNYLESMFYVSGSVRPSYAVTSRGAAKAFALLCGMEGIRSDIVAVERDGTYYYINTVEIDNMRYYIDVYGGEYEMSARELCTHERLLMDDETARMLGIYEESDVGASDCGETYYLQKYTNGETYYDYFISAAEKSDYAALKAAVFGAFDRTPRGEISISSVTSTMKFTNETFGAEFFLDAQLGSSDINAIEKSILRAVDEYAKANYGKSFGDNAVSVYTVGRTMHVTAVIPKIGAKNADRSAAK